MQIEHCPGTLAKGFNTYSSGCVNNLFHRKKVNHFLPFSTPEFVKEESAVKIASKTFNYPSLRSLLVNMSLKKNKLQFSQNNEMDEYHLKLVDPKISNSEQMAANEHLTMQLAKQVFQLETIENALIFYNDGRPAYISKNVAYDFSNQNNINVLKALQDNYDNTEEDINQYISYEEVANFLEKNVAAYTIEIEKFYNWILFNYLFSNAESDLGKLNLISTKRGDYIIAPHFNLLNTKVHGNEKEFSLKKGLFAHDFETDSHRINKVYAYDDFYEFGIKIGISTKRVEKTLDFYRKFNNSVSVLVNRSFLDYWIKDQYIQHYQDRLKLLNFSNAQHI